MLNCHKVHMLRHDFTACILRPWQKWVCSLWAQRCSPLLQNWESLKFRLKSLKLCSPNGICSYAFWAPRIQILCWTDSRQIECTDLDSRAMERLWICGPLQTSYVNSSANGGQRAMPQPSCNAATFAQKKQLLEITSSKLSSFSHIEQQTFPLATETEMSFNSKSEIRKIVLSALGGYPSLLPIVALQPL